MYLSLTLNSLAIHLLITLLLVQVYISQIIHLAKNYGVAEKVRILSC